VNPIAATLRVVRGPTSDTLAKACVDLGDGLCAQLAALAHDPTPERAELAAQSLDGARQHCMRLRSAILAEREG
jgi:hypothetical protein